MTEKLEKLKEFKPFLAIVLLVQSVCMLFLFFMTIKKKSIAGAFLALAAVSGAAGSVLFWSEFAEELGWKKNCIAEDDDLDLDSIDLDLNDKDLSATLNRDEEQGSAE